MDFYSPDPQSECYPGVPDFWHGHGLNLQIVSPDARTVLVPLESWVWGGGITENEAILEILGISGTYTFTTSASIYCPLAWGGAGGIIFFETGGGSVQVAPYLHRFIDGVYVPPGDCLYNANRGEYVEVLIENSAGLSNFVWRFTGFDNVGSISNQNGGAVSWPGIIVANGRIRVDFNYADGSPGWLECDVYPNPRSWSSTSPANLFLQNPYGAMNGTYITHPDLRTFMDPGTPEVPLGLSVRAVDQGPANSGYVTITTGPNKDFIYFKDPPTLFADYQINPYLDYTNPQQGQGNPNNDFTRKQCGNWNPDSNFGAGNNAYISWETLVFETRRHEYNHPADRPRSSHYGKFKGALTDNNIGLFYENKVWGPGNAQGSQQFIDSVIGQGNAMRQTIMTNADGHNDSQGNLQVFPVTRTAYDVFKGFINWFPFNQRQGAPACP